MIDQLLRFPVEHPIATAALIGVCVACYTFYRDAMATNRRRREIIARFDAGTWTVEDREVR